MSAEVAHKKRLAILLFGWVIASALLLPVHVGALPARLVLALDGVAYRDLRALQQGVTRTNFWGQTYSLRAFTADEGYFPVSRMISTFPSASDVAWTDIFRDRPLPGYQRTYYSAAANSLITLNGITTTVEHERQMDWQVQNGFLRAMGYLFPAHTYQYEMHSLVSRFWRSSRPDRSFYAYVRASDDAQHLDRDISVLLCKLDRRLQELRRQYRARQGRDLEILILSDHGHNHAGRGIRVLDEAFLKTAGYRVAPSIQGPRDVVLPVVGVESWVEIHCFPTQSESLARRLSALAGVDILAATIPNQTNRFLVLNSRGERADIRWDPEHQAFGYVPQTGDPLRYAPVLRDLASRQQLDAAGLASADAWMAATMTNHYPLALERIVRGLTSATLNPATILISLDNRYVNDGWWVHQGSRLVTCGSTHGGLDDLCSDGIVLSNFQPTRDTSTLRVAAQFGGFRDVRDYRAEETGVELLTRTEASVTPSPRDACDREFLQFAGDDIYLRLWSPKLKELDARAPLTLTFAETPRFSTSPAPLRITVDHPLALPSNDGHERFYTLPVSLKLEPLKQYDMVGSVPGQPGCDRLLLFSFPTDQAGRPVPF